MKIVVAGGTGFVGRRLIRRLVEDGHETVLLTRGDHAAPAGTRVVRWDGVSAALWTFALEGADAVINLCGAGIADKRWSAARKREILLSRTLSTRAIVSALRQLQRPPKTLINASAVGYYGNVPRGTVDETRERGRGFLAETCAAWENEALEARALGVRVVLARIGIALGAEGGALVKMAPPFRMGLGGPLGSGRQGFPWVHVDDVAGALIHAAAKKDLEGPVNIVSPRPLTMRDFCSELGLALGRPSWAPVPGFVLRILLGEMAQMLLGGQMAVPARLTASGYTFKHTLAETALRAELAGTR